VDAESGQLLEGVADRRLGGQGLVPFLVNARHIVD
jgi:hypothetical protein